MAFQRTLSMDKDVYYTFTRLYPNTFTPFLRRCLKLAIDNKEFFNSIYFSEANLYVNGR